MTTTYVYDGDRNPIRLTSSLRNGELLADYQYEYDYNGNRISRLGRGQDGKPEVSSYAYDALQRVREVEYPGGLQEVYTYDNAGNRLNKATNTLEEQYTYDKRNRLVAMTARTGTGFIGNIANPNKESAYRPVRNPFTESSLTSYEYDRQGNLLSERTVGRKDKPGEKVKRYEYDAFQRTARVTLEEEGLVKTQENFYDAENLRYGVTEEGRQTRFVTNGFQVVAELDEQDSLSKRLIRGNGILAGEYQGSEEDTNFMDLKGYYFFLNNEHGDTELIVGQDGRVRNRYAYDVFGNYLERTEEVENRYGYTGEAFDTVTNQYYLRARYYNPQIARFTQEDLYRGDGLNLYAYCSNNPVMYIDPSGYKKQQGSACLPGVDNNPDSIDRINNNFTPEEIENLKKWVIDEEQMLKDMGLTNNQLGPAIAGVYDKSTGKYYTAINDIKGHLPNELHPLIKDRIDNIPSDLLESYIKTRGAGSHAEVYALNKALLDNPDVNVDDLLVYVNLTRTVTKSSIEIPFHTCPHCEYILNGFNILSDVN